MTQPANTWQPKETLPRDRIVLIKTIYGIISAQWFDGETTHDYYAGDEYTPPVLSCYDDAIVLESKFNEDKTHYFPDVIEWMEIQK